MDSVSLTSLTPLLEGVDKWAELAPLLPVLVSLEIVLSADNAVALASITKRQKSVELQRFSLNVGISLALILRIILILTAQWVINFWQLRLIAAFYLLGLFLNKLRENSNFLQTNNQTDLNQTTSTNLSVIRTIIILAITDLAFSVDSVAAAVAVSDQFLLVFTGALIGVIALRFTSGLFITWLDTYIRLEMAGYIAVGLVGIKLLVNLIITNFILPEWLTLLIIIVLFIWGFSKKKVNDAGCNN